MSNDSSQVARPNLKGSTRYTNGKKPITEFEISSTWQEQDYNSCLETDGVGHSRKSLVEGVCVCHH